ncbi:MAG: FecR family protein [Spirosomataceae bacterium]
MHVPPSLQPEDLIRKESFLNFYFRKHEADVWEWEDWIQDHPEHEQVVQDAIRQLEVLSLHWTETQIREKYERLWEPLPHKVRRLSTWKWIAAAAVLLVGAGTLWFWPEKAPYEVLVASKPLQEHINRGTKPTLVNLPDGSSVLLHPNSRLSYATQFAPDRREVFLDGEAFFEVARDASRPFMVYANEIVTKVIGTSFTIRAPHGSTEAEVIVRTGKVSVYRWKDLQQMETNKPINGVVITQNQQLVLNTQGGQFSKSIIEQPVLLKQTQPFTFQYADVSAKVIFEEIQKAYGVSIYFDEELMAHCPVTASLNDEPLYGKIALVCQAIEAQYEVLDGDIVITGKGCK